MEEETYGKERVHRTGMSTARQETRPSTEEACPSRSKKTSPLHGANSTNMAQRRKPTRQSAPGTKTSAQMLKTV